jgi:hypothetical protein
VFVPNTAAAAIIERLGVELPFDIPLPARTEDEHRRALDAGIDQARRLGLLTPEGPPRDLLTALHALHAPDAAVHVIRGDIAARTDLVLHAARRDGTAALAEVLADGVAITPIRPTGVAAELVARLPAVKPAEGPRSATAPRNAVSHAIDEARGMPGALAAALTGRGVRSGDAMLFAAALTAKRTALAHIYTVPTHGIDVLDTERGRYVLTARGDHVVIAAGRSEHLRAKISDLIG